MTIPYQHNCPHNDNAWCLACSSELGENFEQARARVAQLEARNAELSRTLVGMCALVKSLDEEYVKMPGTFGWVLQAQEALASNGSEALAAVRLAQLELVRHAGENTSLIREAIAALDRVFGAAP